MTATPSDSQVNDSVYVVAIVGTGLGGGTLVGGFNAAVMQANEAKKKQVLRSRVVTYQCHCLLCQDAAMQPQWR